MNRRHALKLSALAAALAIAGTSVAQAQDKAANYPNKPVKVIVPFAAGGNADFLGRLLAQKMSETWGQQFVVENRTGAGGNIGADVIAKANPDGYTIGMGTISSHAINPNLYPKMPYDNIKDFAPVTLVATQPNMLVVNLSVPAKTVPELIQVLKASPGKYTYASSGVGTSIHLAGELFKMMTGTDMTHVPYKSSGQVMNDVVAGHVTMAFDNMSTAWAQAKAGKVRAIAIGTLQRSPQAPDVPSVSESLPGFESVSWHGMFAPANTPPEIVAKLNAEAVRILRLPETVKRLEELGATPVGNTPAEFKAYIAEETVRWGKVVKASGATAD
jgi:tripartite-type tricarboxylate transporter receptor subunit TctC